MRPIIRPLSPIPRSRPQPRADLTTNTPPAPMSIAQRNQVANNKRAAEEAARRRQERAR